MPEKDFISKQISNNIEKGEVTWQSPSNIALVKYWGKKENQIPANPSVSFTLKRKEMLSIYFTPSPGTSV